MPLVGVEPVFTVGGWAQTVRNTFQSGLRGAVRVT
jgi:hypothetical protein